MTTDSPTPSLVTLALRSTLFYIGMALATAIIAPLVLLSFPLSFEWRYELTRYWTRFDIWWLKVTCRLDYHLEGLEHLPTGPVIVLAKHQSSWETLFLNKLLPPLAWVVKRELFWIPLFGWALALVDPIAIDRSSGKEAMKQVLDKGKAYLDKGRWVLLFPEGTRTAPGQRQRYRSGGAMLAAHTGYPILPIAHNAGEYWARHSFLKRPGTVRVVIGPVIDSKGRSTHELLTATENWIEGTMQVISGNPAL